MIKIDIIEITSLSVLFTFLAFNFNIHENKHVIAFIIEHVIALFFALFISGLFYYKN
jgi:hypothetical protein